MSAVAMGGDAAGAAARAADRDRPPSLVRLTGVELRKMVDTRAGFWLLALTFLLAVAVVVIGALAGNGNDHDFRSMLSNTANVVSVLLPIIGILLVTSEWTQRTTLQTFALVPRRERVIIAKVLAAIVISLVALVVCLALSGLGTALSGDGSWSLPIGLLGQDVVYIVTSTIGGVAFGAAFLRSAPAIVLSFVLPIGWAALATISWLEGAGRWLDTSQSVGNLPDHLFSGTDWAHTGTSLAFWMVLPLAVGTWRILRSEVS
jgi:ABC-2 type transport system permease protein